MDLEAAWNDSVDQMKRKVRPAGKGGGQSTPQCP